MRTEKGCPRVTLCLCGSHRLEVTKIPVQVNALQCDEIELTFRQVVESLNADRGQLPRCLPESISPACFPHLQDAPSELSPRTTRVACTSRDPVPPSSATFQRLRLGPHAHEFDQDHLLPYVPRLARSRVRARRSFAA